MVATGRTLLVTYCCREKDAAAGEMPARDRYLSPRIRVAEEAAGLLGWDFAILSGQHGLLAPEAPLAWYDHLLTEDEVEPHARRCADQLTRRGPSNVVLISRTPAVDPGVGPYRSCLETACARAGVPCCLVEWERGTPPAGELAAALARS